MQEGDNFKGLNYIIEYELQLYICSLTTVIFFCILFSFIVDEDLMVD